MVPVPARTQAPRFEFLGMGFRTLASAPKSVDPVLCAYHPRAFNDGKPSSQSRCLKRRENQNPLRTHTLKPQVGPNPKPRTLDPAPCSKAHLPPKRRGEESEGGKAATSHLWARKRSGFRSFAAFALCQQCMTTAPGGGGAGVPCTGFDDVLMINGVLNVRLWSLICSARRPGYWYFSFHLGAVGCRLMLVYQLVVQDFIHLQRHFMRCTTFLVSAFRAVAFE